MYGEALSITVQEYVYSNSFLDINALEIMGSCVSEADIAKVHYARCKT